MARHRQQQSAPSAPAAPIPPPVLAPEAVPEPKAAAPAGKRYRVLEQAFVVDRLMEEGAICDHYHGPPVHFLEEIV